MSYTHYTRPLMRQRRQLAIFALVGFLVALVAVFSQPWRYGAGVRLLIIQRSTFGLDPYTAVKSSERIADNLAQVIYTQDFFSKTLRQDPTIDQTRFPTDPTKRRKTWRKNVRASLTVGTGLLTVTALSDDTDEAAKIAQAIAGVLTVSGKEYIGGELEVKLVDAPLVSRYPVAPNIPLTLGFGALLGLLVGVFRILWRVESRHEHS